MFKKFLIFIIVALIGIQTPLIVSLSTARKITESLDKYKKKVEKLSKPISKPIKEVESIFSFIKKKVPVVKTIEKTIVPDALRSGESGFKEAKRIVSLMYTFMYLSLLLTLLLIALLFFTSRQTFIKNIGTAFIVSGSVSLLEIAVIYYFFIMHFDATFRHFYSQTGWSIGKIIPLVPGIIKAFSRDFVSHIAHVIISRCFINALTTIPLGIILSCGYTKIKKHFA
jgi:hypothetical protein